MAKDRKKKEKKEKPPKSGPGAFSKINLPLVLIPVLLLAGASFFALGIIKQKTKSEAESVQIDNRVAFAIEDAPPPAFEKPPPTLTSNLKQSDIQPSVAGSESQGEPAAASGQPAAAAREEGFPPVQPQSVPAGTETTPVVQPNRPVQPTADERGVVKTEPALSVPSPPQESTGTTVLSSSVTGVASGGPVSRPEEPGLIKPMWQTVDQQWDDIIVEPAATEDVGATSAAWRSINVGQSDDISTQVSTSPSIEIAPPRPPSAGSSKVNEEPKPSRTAPAGKAPRSVKKYSKPSPRKRTRKIPVVAIINESGAPQAGQFYRDVLSAMSSSIGIRIGPIQEAPPRSGPTTIFYGAGMKTKAQALSSRIPGRKTLAPLRNKAEHDILVVVRAR